LAARLFVFQQDRQTGGKMKTRFWMVLFLVVAMLSVMVAGVSAAVPEQSNEPVPAFEFTAELIGVVTGAVVSLFFNYFPGVRVKFAGLTQAQKSLVMIGLMLLTVVAVALLDFFDVINAGLTFDKTGITRIVWTFVAALVANQTTYLASPQTQDVREAKIGPLAAYTSRLQDVE
jgi:hypothetical protein